MRPMAADRLTLDAVPFLDPLDESARKSLEQRARWVRHNANDTIIDRESDSRDVYFVVEGKVRVVNFSLSGREISFDEMEAGGVFGELAALDGLIRPAMNRRAGQT
jgi:CRP/FNR family cyclic AMP-dependent transcriptional regulator